MASSSEKTSSVNAAPQLIGQLHTDGTAELKADSSHVPSARPRSLKAALDAVAASGRAGFTDASSETASEEDYDALKHDPMALVPGGRGGGYESPTRALISGATRPHEVRETSSRLRPSTQRLKSIPITLNKVKGANRYVLTADDVALQQVLEAGLERVHSLSDTVRRQGILTVCRKEIPKPLSVEASSVI